MIAIKVINQKAVQVAFADQLDHFRPVLAAKNKRQFLKLYCRPLVQSANQQNQQVTNSNNQRLIPIARNISFHQCGRAERSRTNDPSTQVSNSLAASSSSQQYVVANLSAPIYVGEKPTGSKESALESLRRRAKDVVERRELEKNNYYNQSFNETLATASERRLVVLLSWLQAQEKHIEKYRQFYLKRGFDVLNVKTSPLDLLLPSIGAKKISKDFMRFMVEKEYSNVVLHGFSVGGYMFGQLLLDIDKQDARVRDKLLHSIRGIVFDSLVPFEGTCIGVANSITSNPLLAKTLEQLIRLYLFFGHNIATKYYLEASEKVWSGPLKCPSLFIMSKDDRISDHRIVDRLAQVWSGLGIETHKLVLDSAPHVQIYQKHRQVYVERVEAFLKHINVD